MDRSEMNPQGLLMECMPRGVRKRMKMSTKFVDRESWENLGTIFFDTGRLEGFCLPLFLFF